MGINNKQTLLRLAKSRSSSGCSHVQPAAAGRLTTGRLPALRLTMIMHHIIVGADAHIGPKARPG